MSFLQNLKDIINPGEAKQRRICAEFLSILSADPNCQQLCADALAETRDRLYEIPQKDLMFLEGIINLHTMLGDEKSRLLLAKVVTYRLVEKGIYKLPLDTPEFWKGVEEIEKLKDPDDFIVVTNVIDPKMNRFDLRKIGIPIEVYYTGGGIYCDLNVRQYEYINGDVCIKMEEGDIVLDCGACFGDTALFFANEVKEKGHVYSFEFVPENIRVFSKNIDLNPGLKEHITLIPHPLGEVSGQELNYSANGAASRVSTEYSPGLDTVTTINIDDFFNEYKLPRVDFIKMDIEGSEIPALRGGGEVIKRFKPKLAISIYHSMDDFVNIVKYIDSLELGYTFYLNHGATNEWETVLMAEVR